MLGSYEYYKQIFKDVPKPFAFVDLDLLDANIRDIAQEAGGKKIRVASKSIRCPEVLRRILAADHVYQGIMCYTADEAAFLARDGFDDLLLGYPQWQAEALTDVISLIGEGKTITFMVDCIEHVEHLEQLAAKLQVTVPVCLDIDMSTDFPGLHFGVYRSPLTNWEHVRPIAEAIVKANWLRLDGIMGYEAQIAGVGDNAPGQAVKNVLIRRLKKSSIRKAAKWREEVTLRLSQMGVQLRFVNAGGTGSMDSSREEAWVTEITAGSGFYSPGLFDNYVSFRYKPAAGYAVEVVRRPQPNIVTCMGGGYTASGPTGADKRPKPYLPEGLELLALEGAGEVQTPLRVRGEVKLELGDPVFFRHAKAGELCERFLVLYAVSQGSIVSTYPTYRGMGACFL
ncbi:amino acid deaminase/aldolase [Paenibacillus qinlingensis]|uniref:D-serine deaminase-like pyridoxal phosphate-dependent protein n=1 Tax=Paenibacillus qinlingensis TaxID=1837343 RepID=A0ABU1P2D9_9BACL|nr:amino acid deaminase/aldolase [Paenibacillus qinlingensis]MDR6553910.1 D-serine deaminase-like pyridoxal phosphate-dependent protein [Paenibacillus qinlingensis]